MRLGRSRSLHPGDKHCGMTPLAFLPLCLASNRAWAGESSRVAKAGMTAVVGNHDLSSGHENAARRRERRLQAFHPGYRRYVAELSACSRELEDLADSFPGAAVRAGERLCDGRQARAAVSISSARERPCAMPPMLWGSAGGCAGCPRRRSRRRCRHSRSTRTSPSASPTSFRARRRDPGLAGAREPRLRGGGTRLRAVDRAPARPCRSAGRAARFHGGVGLVQRAARPARTPAAAPALDRRR